MTTLDYSALHQPVTKTDIASYEEWRRAGKPPTSVLRVSIIVVVVVVVANIILALTLGGDGAVFFSLLLNMSALFAAIPVALVVGIALLAHRIQKRQQTKVYKFAVANGLTFSAHTASTGLKGMIFEQGHSRQLVAALLFPDGTQIGNYQYTTGGGKNRHTHSWGFARVQLSRRLPHMVLDARANNLFGKFSNLPSSFRGQTLSLEGDFDKHFTLYAPKQYERDALYVFTPDVMAAMIDAGRDYDMEVIDDQLMLYTRGKFALDSEAELSSLLRIIESIHSELHDQTKRYADERIGDRAIDIVAEPGRRLKRRISIGSIVALVLLVAYIVLIFWPR